MWRFAVRGEIPKIRFEPETPLGSGNEFGFFYFERAAKVSGSRFVFTKERLQNLNVLWPISCSICILKNMDMKNNFRHIWSIEIA